MPRGDARKPVAGKDHATAEKALDGLKEEIAEDMSVDLGPDQTSRVNGSVGGQMTKEMVKFAENHAEELASEHEELGTSGEGISAAKEGE